MKLTSFLIVFIFNLMLWTFVKTAPIRKGLGSLVEKDCTAKDHSKILNVEAESSVNPQIQKYKETLKPKVKITKKVTDKGKNKVFNKREYYKEYYQKNKEKIDENQRNYDIKNKRKKSQHMSIYYQKNKEKFENRNKIYYQNNKEKLQEYQRKYRQKKKNNQSDNNEGTSFVNPETDDFTNKGKLPVDCEEEGNLFNQVEEERNNGEDDQNKNEVEEPNKFLRDETNDGAESSVNTQKHKYKETLTKRDTDNGKEKVFNKS
ncbi:unnamed protein product [Meloidogyne enterolobii]|uniref:Uncharacterized protein n=1 Tax=Meloidogyne enterolobii TaxID=390850 RepID=A0ACB0ZZW4_MELEN